LLAETVRHCELLTATALDHVQALEKCITGQPLPHYVPMTLARSVLEAVVQFCYLTGCDLDAESRLIRGAAVLLDSARNEEAAVLDMRQSILPRDTVDTVWRSRAAVDSARSRR
jgi:hypothetical protein